MTAGRMLQLRDADGTPVVAITVTPFAGIDDADTITERVAGCLEAEFGASDLEVVNARD